MIVNRSSWLDVASAPAGAPATPAAQSQAAAAASSLSASVILAQSPPRYTSSASIFRSKRSITRRLVSTWRMPHWAMHSFITSEVTRVVQVDRHAAIDAPRPR